MNNYTELLPGRYGWVCCVKADPFQTTSIRHYGDWARHEVNLMRQFVKPGAIVLDIGANIGSVSLALASMVQPGGVVIAFEPQRLCYLCLCANVALNSLAHVVDPQMMAVGKTVGDIAVPPFNISAPVYNTGGVRLKPEEGVEQRTAQSGVVPLITVDSMHLPKVDFLKIDVEGMEADVICGASETIRRTKPAIMCEQLDHMPGTRDAVIAALDSVGYKAWKLLTPLHDRDNIRGDRSDVFKQNDDQTVVAVHKSAGDPILPEGAEVVL